MASDKSAFRASKSVFRGNGAAYRGGVADMVLRSTFFVTNSMFEKNRVNMTIVSLFRQQSMHSLIIRGEWSGEWLAENQLQWVASLSSKNRLRSMPGTRLSSRTRRLM